MEKFHECWRFIVEPLIYNLILKSVLLLYDNANLMYIKNAKFKW